MSRKVDKSRAISNLRQEAQRRVIKDEVMKFRLESETLERLLTLSQRLNKPAGTLVRDWVIEKLNRIESEPKETPGIAAISIIADSLAKRGLLQDDQVSRIHQLLAKEEEIRL